MDKQFIKGLLSGLNKHAFDAFIRELFDFDIGFGEQNELISIKEIGEGVYFQKILDSYGESLHTVFLLHFTPLELFKIINENSIADPELIKKLKKVRAHYKGKKGYWGMVSPELKETSKLQSLAFITNFHGFEKSVYDNVIIPQYIEIANKVGLKKPTVVGSFDSFVELDFERTEEIFKDFILKNQDGICISLEEEHVNVSKFYSERNLSSGVLAESKYPYEPILITYLKNKDEILAEFEYLIRKETKESELEKFLVSYYQDIFGYQYDKIETQLWLRFPELDVASKNRRLDIFLRNSIVNDWELFEIKRVIELTSTYRDMPVLSREITYAIQQIKNYSKILTQDSVKRFFSRQGIEYYQPSLNIIVGKTPQIPHEQWRWLLAQNEGEVKILTYDKLISEMKLRLKYLQAI
jgi:hypothetical protein